MGSNLNVNLPHFTSAELLAKTKVRIGQHFEYSDFRYIYLFAYHTDHLTETALSKLQSDIAEAALDEGFTDWINYA